MPRPSIAYLSLFLLGILGVCPLEAREAPAKLTSKDYRVLPFCGTAKRVKLDPDAKGMFDELKVTKSDRLRIHGKKKADSGRIDGRVVFHIGKLALFPAGDRTGKAEVRFNAGSDATCYYISLELGDALESVNVELKKGTTYVWNVQTTGTDTSFTIYDGGNALATIKQPTDKITGIGFASTVRWVGNESDIAITFD